MDYAEQWQFRHGNDTFWQRCEEAILNVASAIRLESEAIEHHAERLVWAKATEVDPAAALAHMRNRIVTHWLIQSVGASATDTQVGETPGLKQVIESLVNDFATT